ncbi:hypothetical protein CEXT_720491 [Caerostris extrusa]|uniref:Uncharacterized protein n=1 Tax=Caerostris extrusa TaxID=172846 RepID=A0AAV4UWK1_CAEEX|nr:hypothetical protein CEXT_720491 [Caerostris extrusa]
MYRTQSSTSQQDKVVECIAWETTMSSSRSTKNKREQESKKRRKKKKVYREALEMSSLVTKSHSVPLQKKSRIIIMIKKNALPDYCFISSPGP